MKKDKSPLWHDEFGLTPRQALEQITKAIHFREEEICQFNVMVKCAIRDKWKAFLEKNPKKKNAEHVGAALLAYMKGAKK